MSKSFVPPFFSKFDKQTSDLLKDDDFSLDNKLSVKAVAENGVTFTASAKHCAEPCKKDDDAKCDKRPSSFGNLKIEAKDKRIGEFEFEADTHQLLSAKLKTIEVAKNLKFEIKASHNDEKKKGAEGVYERKKTISVEAMHTYAPFSESIKVNIVDLSKADVTVGLSTGMDGISIGTEFNHDGTELKKYSFGASAALKNLTIHGKTEGYLDAVHVGAFVDVLPRVNFATLGSMSKDKKTGLYERTIKFGLDHKIDSTSGLRAMITQGSKSTFSGQYFSRLNPSAKLTLTTSVDLNTCFKADCEKTLPKLGAKLELGDI